MWSASAVPVAPEEHLLQKLVSIGASSCSSCFNSVGFFPRFCFFASTQADHARAEFPNPLEQVIYPSSVLKKSLQLADRKPQVECGLHFQLHFANYCIKLKLVNQRKEDF